jgi:hypothetical protein
VIQRTVAALVLITGLVAPAFSQTTLAVSQTDIQRLQDYIALAATDVAQLRTRDNTRALELQDELDLLREEVIYLKVKLRKERSLARSEYADVRDRIDDLRTRATAEPARAAAPTPAAPRPAPVTPAPSTASRGTASTTAAGSSVEVPTGTEMDVRLQNTLNSGTAMVEDRFEATTRVDININGRTVVPAGSIARGVVTAVEPATRTNRTARMTVSFDQLTVNGRAYPMRGTVTQAIEGEGIRGEAGRVGTGAGVGAIIGGILGGFKGALAGILIGAGGTIAATEGREVELPQGAVLRVRFDSPVQISTAR